MTVIILGGSAAVVFGVLAGAVWHLAGRGDLVAADPVEEADESRLSWRSLCRDKLGVRADQLRGDVTRN